MITIHQADLIERHAITTDAPDPPPTGIRLAQVRQRAWNELTRQAEQWAVGEDVAIDTEPFETQHADGRPKVWGVRFTIVVGVGEEALNQEPSPPWNWSGRWVAWWETFRLMAKPDLRLVDDAEVIPLLRPG